MEHIPPASNYGYSTEQARRDGNTQEHGRTHEFFRDQHHYHLFPHTYRYSPELPHYPYLYPRTHFPTHPHGMHEAIQRELEKERIREEIIISEIARRRILEAEVRRELMVERESALRRGVDGVPFTSPPGVGLESPMRLSVLGTRAEGRSTEERFAVSLEERESLNRRCESGGVDATPFKRRAADIRVSEVKPVSEGSKEKESIILLAKPAESISGSKRKAVLPPGLDDSELSSEEILKKRAKEEWSCALCQVSAASEQGLNEHLKDKRHKSNEAALRAQRAAKNYSIGLFPKKAPKPNQVRESMGPCIMGVKAVYMPVKQTGEGSLKRDDLLTLPEHQNLEVEKIVSEVQKVLENNETRHDLKTGEASSKSDNLQQLQEIRNSDDLKNHSEVHIFQMIDDSMKKELKIRDPISKREDLQPLQETQNSNDREKKQLEVQEVLQNNASDKKELMIMGVSSKRDDLQPLQESESPSSMPKKQSDIKRVRTRKKNGLTKKRFYFLCEICQLELTCPKTVDFHMNGKRHAKNVKLLAKSDQTGGVVPCAVSEKTAVFSHHAVGVAEDGKTMRSDNAHQTLEQLSLELADGVKPEENKPETGLPVDESLAEDCGVACAAKPEHDLNNDKARCSGQGWNLLPFRKTQNSDDLKLKQLDVGKVQSSDKVDESQAEHCGGVDASWPKHDLNNDKVEPNGQEPTLDGMNAEGNKPMDESQANGCGALDAAKPEHVFDNDKVELAADGIKAEGDKPMDKLQDKDCGVWDVAKPEHEFGNDKVEPRGQELPVDGIKTEGNKPMDELQAIDFVALNAANPEHNFDNDKVDPKGLTLDLQPSQATQNSDHLKREQSEFQIVQKNDDSQINELMIVEASSKTEVLKPLQGTPKSQSCEQRQSDFWSVQKNDASMKKVFKTVKGNSESEGMMLPRKKLQEIRKQFSRKRKESGDQMVKKNDASPKEEFKTGEASSKGDDLRRSVEKRKLLAWKRKQSEVQTMEKNNVARRKELPNFWCDICQVGAPNLWIMNAHQKGKKHVNRMNQLGISGQTGRIAAPQVSPFAFRKISGAPFIIEQIAGGSHHAGWIVGDGKTLPSDNADLTLEQTELESHGPIDETSNVVQTLKQPILEIYEPMDRFDCVDQSLKPSRLEGTEPIDGVTNVDQTSKQLTGAPVSPYTENEKNAALSYHAVGVIKQGKVVALDQLRLESHEPMDDGIKPMACIPGGRLWNCGCSQGVVWPER